MSQKCFFLKTCKYSSIKYILLNFFYENKFRKIGKTNIYYYDMATKMSIYEIITHYNI